MQAEFESAARWLAAAPEAASLSNDVKLEIYGIYKTLTEGPVPNCPRPSVFYPRARVKYDAWMTQGRLYDDRVADARTRYLSIATGLGWQAGEVDDGEDDIDWDAEDEPPSSGGGLGLQVSSIQAEHEEAGPLLHEAVVSENLPRVQELLKSQLQTVNETGEFSEDGETPLDVAKIAGKEDVAQLLTTYRTTKA